MKTNKKQFYKKLTKNISKKFKNYSNKTPKNYKKCSKIMIPNIKNVKNWRSNSPPAEYMSNKKMLEIPIMIFKTKKYNNYKLRMKTYKNNSKNHNSYNHKKRGNRLIPPPLLILLSSKN